MGGGGGRAHFTNLDEALDVVPDLKKGLETTRLRVDLDRGVERESDILKTLHSNNDVFLDLTAEPKLDASIQTSD